MKIWARIADSLMTRSRQTHITNLWLAMMTTLDNDTIQKITLDHVAQFLSDE